MYTNPWMFNGTTFEFDDIGEGEGFVYLITNLINGRKYIGKKSFWARRKDKRTGRRKTTESDWKSYYGSNDELKAEVASNHVENFRREILHICFFKKQMSYLEESEQWQRNVLLDESYYNTNIAGRFFVRERHIFERKHVEITDKNDAWREIKRQRMTGENNIAKRPDIRAKISAKKAGEKHHQFGKPISGDHLAALRDGHKIYHDKLRTGEIDKPHPFKGRVYPKVTCPHCKKEGGGPTMGFYHFDKCKKKP